MERTDVSVTNEQIKELIHNKQWTALRQLVEPMPVPEIVDALLELSKLDRVLFFRAMPRHQSSEVFSFLTGEQQRLLLDDLTDEETRHLLTGLAPDDRTALFEELPGQITQKLLNLLSPEALRETRQLLGYPEESVGRLMTPHYVAVRPDWTIPRALEHIRSKGEQSETINYVYVTDEKWKLLDELPLSRFILADPEQTVTDIMDYQFVSLTAFEDRENAVQMMERYDLNVLPVVDSEGVLVGIVTFDDVMDVAQLEATEDFQRISGIEPVEVQYTEAGPALLWRKRILWLMVLLLADFFSSSVIAFYEDTLATMVALAFFIPMLIDSGGNTGTQSATLIVRSIALGQLDIRDWPKIVWKEIRVGVLLGATLGAVVYARGFFWIGGPEIGLVVGMTMVVLVIWANLVGAILPMIIHKLKLDPAVVSSPFITTTVDVTGLVIYFNVARWVLGI
jgi:magnesium transporter